MMRRIALTLALPAILWAAWAAAATPTSAPSAARKPSFEDYGLVLSRNVFSRDRSSASPRSQPPSPPAPVRRSEDYLVLTGAAVQDDLRVAFFEDSRSGETHIIALGRTIGSGTVVSISLDVVEYRSQGTTRRISVGENLVGVATPGYSSPAPSPAPTSQPRAAAASGPSTQPAGTSGSDDILERMRRRRQQEQNQ